MGVVFLLRDVSILLTNLNSSALTSSFGFSAEGIRKLNVELVLFFFFSQWQMGVSASRIHLLIILLYFLVVDMANSTGLQRPLKGQMSKRSPTFFILSVSSYHCL